MAELDKVDKFTEAIHKAMEIHVQNAIGALGFNKTEQAEIVDITNAKAGDYVVSNGSTRYHAYSDDLNYTLGTKVYVLIPNNDYTQQKIILNKVKRTNETALSYVSPLEGYSPKTDNLLEDSNKNATVQEIKDIETILNFSENKTYRNGDYVYYNNKLYRCTSYNEVLFLKQNTQTNKEEVDLDNWTECYYIPDHLLIATMLLDSGRENLVVDQSLLKNYDQYEECQNNIEYIQYFIRANLEDLKRQKIELVKQLRNGSITNEKYFEDDKMIDSNIQDMYDFALDWERYEQEKFLGENGHPRDTKYWSFVKGFSNCKKIDSKFRIIDNPNETYTMTDGEVDELADYLIERKFSIYDDLIANKNQYISSFFDQEKARSILANYSGKILIEKEEGEEEKNKIIYPEGKCSKIIYLSDDLSVTNSSENSINNNYKYMGFSAAFKTLFDSDEKVVAGDYGIDIVILYSKQIQDKAQDRKYETVTYRMNTSNMIGNIYNFTTEHTQEALFQLETDEATNVLIHRIMLIAYQNGDFKAINTKSGERATFSLNHTKEDSDTGDEVLLDDNIFISKFSIKLGDEIDQSNLYDQIQIYTEDGSFYDSAEKTIVDKKVNLKWTHIDPLTGVSNEYTRVPKNVANEIANSVPTISWYQDEFNESGEYRTNIEKTSREYDELKGILEDYDEFYKENYKWISEWEKYAEEEENLEDAWNQFLRDNGYKNADFQEKITQMNESIKKIIIAFGLKPSKHYYYDPVNKALILTASGRKTATSKITRNSKSSSVYLSVDETLGGEGWIPIELESKQNSMTIDYTPRANSNLCKLKCVIQYGPQVEKDGEMVYDTSSPYYHIIHSNELVFTNLTKIVDMDTWSVTAGLQFNFLDKSNGFYPLYNYTGAMIDPSNANKTRKLEVNAETTLFGESYINGNEIILWKLPKENTMLEFERVVDDPDVIIKKEEITNVYDKEKNDYKQGDKVICRYKKDSEDNIVLLGINDGIVNNKNILTEYFICIKDYTDEMSTSKKNPFTENSEYWKEYTLTPEQRIVYPSHRMTNLTENEVNELLNPHNLQYDKDYYYIKYEANESNNSVIKTRNKVDEEGNEVLDNENKPVMEQYTEIVPARNYINYKLKNLYKPYFYNNTVTCYLIKNIADGFFVGNAQVTFGNKDNNGDDYTLVFYLGDLVTPIDETIDATDENNSEAIHTVTYTIDQYISDTTLDEENNASSITDNVSSEMTNSLTKPQVLLTNDWEIVGGPEEAISLDSPYYQEIIFKVLDNDGIEINLTKEQKNNIIRMWTDSIEDGYYSGLQNAKNLCFLCKAFQETKTATIENQENSVTITNTYYTDIAVKASEAALITDLEFIVLKLQVNSKVLEYDSNEQENTSFSLITNKSYNLNNVNLTALLPLNFRKNDFYYVYGTNFINYGSSGALNKSFSSNYVFNNGSMEDAVENIETEFLKVVKIIENTRTLKENVISAFMDIYDSLNEKTKIPAITEDDNETDADDPVDLEKLKEEEQAALRAQVKTNFPNLFVEIPEPVQANQYYGISNLDKIQESLYTLNDECQSIVKAIEDNQTKFILFKANNMSAWSNGHFNKIRAALHDQFGAEYADDVNLSNEIDERYFRSEKNKAKVKKNIDKAIEENESTWSKLNKNYDKKISEDKKKLNSKISDIEKEYKKLIEYNNNIGSFNPSDFSSLNSWLIGSEINDSEGTLEKQIKEQGSQNEDDIQKLAETARDTLTASLLGYFKEFDSQLEKRTAAQDVKNALNILTTVGINWTYYPQEGQPSPTSIDSTDWKKDNMDCTDLKEIQEKILRFYDSDYKDPNNPDIHGKKYKNLTSEEKSELKKYINDFNSLKEKKIKEQDNIIKNANKILEKQRKNIKPYINVGTYEQVNKLPTELAIIQFENLVEYNKKDGIIVNYRASQKIVDFKNENIANRAKLLDREKGKDESKITRLIREKNELNNKIQIAHNGIYGEANETSHKTPLEENYETQKQFLEDCTTLWSWNGVIPSTNLVKDTYIDALKRCLKSYINILSTVLPPDLYTKEEGSDEIKTSNFLKKVDYSSQNTLQELNDLIEEVWGWNDCFIRTWGLAYLNFWFNYKKLGVFDILISQYDDTINPHQYVNIVDKYKLDTLKANAESIQEDLETELDKESPNTETVTALTKNLNDAVKLYQDALKAKEKEFQYYPNIAEDGHTLKAPPVLTSNIEKNIAILGYSEYGEIVYIMPLIMLRSSNGQISAIKKWDGQAIVDQNNNRIMSAVIAAGTKTSDNNFTGVIIGDIEKDNTNIDYDTPTINGIYGYHNGAQSFGIKTDGTSFLGKEGSGRIEFDGNKGTIKSGNYSETDHAGTCFDLDDGWLDVYNNENDGTYFKTHIGKKNSSDPIFSIQAPNGNQENPGVFELMHVSEDNYYLQSSNYTTGTNGTGIRLDLKNGMLDSHGALSIKGGEGSTILFGEYQPNNPDAHYFYVDSNGEVTCQNITIIGGSITQASITEVTSVNTAYFKASLNGVGFKDSNNEEQINIKPKKISVVTGVSVDTENSSTATVQDINGQNVTVFKNIALTVNTRNCWMFPADNS